LKFKAAVLRKSRHPLSIEFVEFRDKLSAGQVLVRIQRTAICGSQIGEIDAVKGPDKYLPHLLGHEAVGVVIDKGDSHKVSNGDQVILHWIKGSGRNAEPPSYLSSSGRINAGQITTFSEYAVISENRLTKVPVCNPLYIDAWSTVGCAYLTAYGTIKRVIGSERLSRTLVLGGGGIGQAAVTLLSEVFDSKVTLIEPANSRAEYCRQLGAEQIYDWKDTEQIKDVFDSSIDTTGIPDVIEFGYNALSNSGIVALIGVTPSGKKISIDPMPLHYGREIIGIYGGEAKPDQDIPEIIDHLQKSRFLKHLVHTSYSLEEINFAIDKIRSGLLVGRAILNLKP